MHFLQEHAVSASHVQLARKALLEPVFEHSKWFMRECGTAGDTSCCKSHHEWFVLGESAAIPPWRLAEQGHLRGGRLANAAQPGASGLHNEVRWACMHAMWFMIVRETSRLAQGSLFRRRGTLPVSACAIVVDDGCKSSNVVADEIRQRDPCGTRTW